MVARSVKAGSMRRTVSLVACLFLGSCASVRSPADPPHSSAVLFDAARQRPVPVQLHMPSDASRCTPVRRCPVAVISSGYGISSSSYSFISSALTGLGYLAVAVQHELPSDPPLATHGDLFAGRTPAWQRGAENLRFVLDAMRRSHPGFDWERPVLIGHSNGGDISAWLVHESPLFAGTLVTLDSRRVPLPRGASAPRVLSIRASDFPADAGVLPSAEELEISGGCVVEIAGARHNEMHDGGPGWLKAAIVDGIVRFLEAERAAPDHDRGGSCSCTKAVYCQTFARAPSPVAARAERLRCRTTDSSNLAAARGLVEQLAGQAELSEDSRTS